MITDNQYYYSDFGRIPWAKVPGNFKVARHDRDVRMSLAAYIWNAWKTQNTATLKSLGLKYF
jgi:hypothetical protein